MICQIKHCNKEALLESVTRYLMLGDAPTMIEDIEIYLCEECENEY